MDIYNTANKLSLLLGLNQTQAVQKKQVAKAVTASPSSSSNFEGDRAQVSAAGTMAASSDPEVRMDKVAPIQAAIASGTYNVNAAAVAGKLVANMLGE